jgi:NitT/TauT family transport system ATP-binding protein
VSILLSESSIDAPSSVRLDRAQLHRAETPMSTASPQGGARFIVQGLDFSYAPGEFVFDDLHIDVRAGEFLVLIGPSGCGKTTLLNLLSGFVQPQRGSVTLDDRAVRPETQELGYVFQTPQLFAWLDALENVRFGLRMAGDLPVDEQRRRAREALALVGLAEAADKFPHELSGGMRQRVSLARSIVLRPRVLLMDEPFAALDAITRRELNEEILGVWHELGQTVVFITHDIDEAVFLADRVVVLGKVPAGIHSELAIDLPRPRTWRETRRQPAFAALGAELMERIEDVSRPRAVTGMSQRPCAAQVVA